MDAATVGVAPHEDRAERTHEQIILYSRESLALQKVLTA
jgi:hypothetical protein